MRVTGAVIVQCFGFLGLVIGARRSLSLALRCSDTPEEEKIPVTDYSWLTHRLLFVERSENTIRKLRLGVEQDNLVKIGDTLGDERLSGET